jgi:hypothetical protein
LQLEQLPLPEKLRTLIVRRHRAVLLKQQASVARGLEMGGNLPVVDIHFSPIPKDDRTSNVLIMFEPQNQTSGHRKNGEESKGNNRRR